MCGGGKTAVDLDQPADQRRRFVKGEIDRLNDAIDNRAHGTQRVGVQLRRQRQLSRKPRIIAKVEKKPGGLVHGQSK